MFILSKHSWRADKKYQFAIENEDKRIPIWNTDVINLKYLYKIACFSTVYFQEGSARKYCYIRSFQDIKELAEDL